jgi:hypothetical protein
MRRVTSKLRNELFMCKIFTGVTTSGKKEYVYESYYLSRRGGD